MASLSPAPARRRLAGLAKLGVTAGVSAALVAVPVAPAAADGADEAAADAARARQLAATADAAAAAATAAAPLFPPYGARWSRDLNSRSLKGTYRVLPRRIGRVQGRPDNYGVRVWQELLRERGHRITLDGVYGPQTARAVKAFQRTRRDLRDTGAVNYATAIALLAPTIKREARRVRMSADLLCGHLNLESTLDPQAVNPNGRDLGIGQINIGKWNPGTSIREAFDEDYAIRYMANRDRGAYNRYRNWRIAVYDYNYPADAQRWYRTGKPSERGANYSRVVFRGCPGPDFPGNP